MAWTNTMRQIPEGHLRKTVEQEPSLENVRRTGTRFTAMERGDGWYQGEAVHLITERELDLPDLKVIESVKDRFTATVYYQNYHLLKKSSRYNTDVANELRKIVNNITMQIKDGIFSGKSRYPSSVFYKISSWHVMHAKFMRAQESSYSSNK